MSKNATTNTAAPAKPATATTDPALTPGPAPAVAAASASAGFSARFRSRFPTPNICLDGKRGCQFVDHVFVTDDPGVADLLRRNKACGTDLEFWEESPALQAEIAKVAGDAAASGGGDKTK